MSREEIIADLVSRAEAATNKARILTVEAATYLKPALEAVHRVRNYDVVEVEHTAHLNGGYTVTVLSNGERDEYFILYEIAHADNPAEAASAYAAAKRERQRVQDAEKVQALRLKSYRDAGLDDETINTIEAARIKLAVVGKPL